MDNSGNFTNAIIENMNENMITFSYDLPGSYRNDDDSGDDEYDYGNGGNGGGSGGSGGGIEEDD